LLLLSLLFLRLIFPVPLFADDVNVAADVADDDDVAVNVADDVGVAVNVADDVGVDVDVDVGVDRVYADSISVA